MHEMSLCESVLQILELQAQSQKFSRVTTVRMEIGAFACVEPEAMRFSFESVTRGTLAEHAQLEIVQTRGNAWCLSCERLIPVRQRFSVCPACNNDLLAPTGGDELRIKELEVE